ncbi:unnamed protein product, partial [Lepidochelys olivacea]
MPFRLNQQVSKSVQMMHQKGPFAFASIEEEKVKILELPYANREMSMIILLPNVVSGLDEYGVAAALAGAMEQLAEAAAETQVTPHTFSLTSQLENFKAACLCLHHHWDCIFVNTRSKV